MKIRDKKRFIYAVAALIFSIIIFATLLFVYQTRFIIGGFLMLLISAISFYFAFAKDQANRIEAAIDERDIYIIRKSSQTSLKIINYIFFFGGMLLLLLYGIGRAVVLLVGGIVFLLADIIIFLVILGVSAYYERIE